MGGISGVKRLQQQTNFQRIFNKTYLALQEGKIFRSIIVIGYEFAGVFYAKDREARPNAAYTLARH